MTNSRTWPPPTVTSISPTAGPTAGNTTVTITGTNLGTAATATVTFGATAATIVTTTVRHSWPPVRPAPREAWTYRDHHGRNVGDLGE